MIKPELFEPYAPDEEGERVRINHEDDHCSGSSASMVVTRKDDGSITAYCFRCGEKGYVAGKFSKFSGIRSKVRGKLTTVPKEVKYPADTSHDYHTFPIKVKKYFLRSGITADDIKSYGIGYSPRYERVFLPVWQEGELVAMQARYFGDEKEQPKFITRYKYDSNLWTHLPKIGAYPSKFVILVEDLLSGIRVAKHEDALVLYGVHLHDGALNFLTTLDKPCIVFLDDDNSQVKQKAVTIRERLRMLNVKCFVHHSGGLDPKEYTDEQLMDMVGGY